MACSTPQATRDHRRHAACAAAEAIADVVSPDQLNASYIVPSVFDENVSKAVARAVLEASRSKARSVTDPLAGSLAGAKESALT